MTLVVRAVDLRLIVPFAISRAVRTEKRVVVAELAEGQRIARGEACPDAFFGESAEGLEERVRAAAALLPEDPGDLEALARRLDERHPHGGAVRCAIDILGHDRAAQAAGVPLRRMLGIMDDPPPTSFTIGIAEPHVMAERAGAAAAQGFRVLKVKLGRDDDVPILRAIRERFSGAIRVDPNAGWTADDAASRIERIAPFDIEFVEQPLPPEDIDGMRRLRERSPVPIVADEAAVGLADLDRLAGACDGINVKLQKAGGVGPALAMIRRARELGLRVMLGCRAAETSVGIAAAAHLAGAVDWADLDGNLLVADDPFVAVGVEEGRFVFPDRPGLGALPR